MSKLFAKETDLVGAFGAWLAGPDRLGMSKTPGAGWTAYHETGGWDLLLSNDETGIQVGIEAKLSLNAKVLAQALPYGHWRDVGPDYRAVLVPEDSCQHHMAQICRYVGLTIIAVGQREEGWPTKLEWHSSIAGLPQESDRSYENDKWHPWLPEQRITLPDYVPDVCGGDSAPVALTPWKIKAIKLMILLRKRGAVTRADMRALDISPTRWTDRAHGYLAPGPNGYVSCDTTPNLQAQHPRNWSEIEADFENWNPHAEREAQ